jgi:NDP-sugar pyrophosphorylase family protein
MKPYVPFNKALVEIRDGQILLEYQVEWLMKHGVDQVVLALDGETYGRLRALRPDLLENVECSIERRRLGTGGAVVKALDLLGSSMFYLMNVDDIILSDSYGPNTLLGILESFDGALGSVLLGRTRFPFGVAETMGNRVVGFRQKPILDFKVCTGHYAFFREGVERYFPKRGNFEDEALHRMARDGLLYSLELEGDWVTVNNVKQLEASRRRLSMEKSKSLFESIG